MAQEICAKQEPPLMQIGERHKVACHFAGEMGKAPSTPVTAALLGVDAKGDRDPSLTPAEEVGNKPGFSDSWVDLAGHRMGSKA